MQVGDLVCWVAMNRYGIVLWLGDESFPAVIMFPEGHYEVEQHLLEVINGRES